MLKFSAFIIAFSVFMGLVLGMKLSVLPMALAKSPPVIFPNRTYTAEYEKVQSNDPRGPERLLISCNGKGLLIYEWNKLRFLYDAHKQLQYIVDPSDKIINIHPLRETAKNSLDEEMFLQLPSEYTGYKQLGVEKMIGRNCRVYVNEFQPGSEKRWYDRDTKVLVFQKLDATTGMTLVTKLLKYSYQALPPKEFELPKRFEIRDSTK
ncbi:MAG: hypothetical protein DKT66_16780 [Candidatus Melainabacteria bacterium]|nr:MAG: hypothetical protein DKT66_16780 [Candidatus Melainabacteria bacterium]